MGCDYYIVGHLFNTHAQEKVVAFMADYYGGGCQLITPQKDLKCDTVILGNRKRPEVVEADYPFNFYGIIPHPLSFLISDGQLIFDRNRGGQVVNFHCLPPAFAIKPQDGYQERPGVEVALEINGYDRLRTSNYQYCLMFYVIQQRWWPGLRVYDDWRYFKEVADLVEEFGILPSLLDEKAGYAECWGLFKRRYDRKRRRLIAVPGNLGEMPISDLKLGTRARNCLAKAGLTTVGDLVGRTAGELRTIRNLGYYTAEAIKDALAKVGIYMKD